MKKGIDLGLTPIKCEHKEGCDKLKDLHVRINNILYKWTYRYISPKDAEDIYNSLCTLGKILSTEEITQRAEEKRKEILNSLRPKCGALKTYKDTFKLTAEDIPQATATSKYTTSMYLKAKENQTLSDDNIMELLKEAKRVRNNHLTPLQLSTEPMSKLTNELIEILHKRYE